MLELPTGVMRASLSLVAILVDAQWVPQVRYEGQVIGSLPEIHGPDPRAVCAVARELWPEVLAQQADSYPKPLLYYRCGWDLRLLAMHREAWQRRYQVTVDW